MTHHHAASLGGAHHGDRRRLLCALALAVLTVALELWGGLRTGSLALLADAVHVCSDVGALALALFALWLAARPHTSQETYGFHRAEVLAATLNALVLLLVSVLLGWEAIGRIATPRVVQGLPLTLIASAGLSANLLQAWLLREAHSINMRAARLHILSDVGGSLVAVAAGIGVQLSGWSAIDPVLSLVIVALIVFGALRMLRETLSILMEHTPPGLDAQALAAALLEDRDVLAVHEMHLWTITSGFVAFTAHIEVQPTADAAAVAGRCAALLRQRFGIEHATIQPEYAALHELGEPRERRVANS